MIPVRQSTARTVIIGPVLDADGAAVTDIAVGDLKISKNGAAPAALNGSATLTHRNTGHYSLALTTSDTDTVGGAEIVIDDTTNAMPIKALAVIEEAVYDALFAASAAGYNATTPLDAAGIRTAVGLASADLDTQLDALPTAAENRAEIDSNSTQLASIVSTLGTNGDGLTAIPWSSAWDAEVQSECADALAAYNVVATTDLPSNFATLGINGSGHISRVTLTDTTTTNTDMRGTDSAATSIALSAVAGNVSSILADTNELQTNQGDWATATGFSTHSAADVWTSGTRTLTAFTFAVDVASDGLDSVTLPTNIITGASIAASAFDGKGDWNTTTPPTAGSIADAVWDEAQSGHTTAGTFGKYLDSEVSGAGGSSSSPSLLQSTTIATLTSQTEFALTAGSADDDAYNGATVILTDQATSTQKAVGKVSDYTGSTKTVTLDADPAFTIATGDSIDIIAAQPWVNVRQVNGTAVTAGALSVSVTSPVAANGTITLYAGASYSSNTDQLGIELENYTGPDPTDATFVFRAATTEAFNAGDSSNVLGSITTTAALDGSNLPLLFNLTKTQTALLVDENPPKKPWNYRYTVLWTKDGEEYVIAEGSLTAKQIIGGGA